MEFGKVSNLEPIDWSLPPDDPLSAEFLGGVPAKTRFWIGAPAWGHKEWVGQIYPPKTKAAEFLWHYSRNFNCIELNTSHYRIPTADQIEKWVAQVPPEFLFCPKILQTLSHGGLLDRDLLKTWLESLPHYGANLGPCFLQLPPTFDYSQKAALFHFLQAWPENFELALEFRHPSWFQNGHLLPALAKYLYGRRIGLVLLDVAGRRDLIHTSITASFTMLRFIGNDLHPSDAVRSREWAARIKSWQQQGLERFFFMVHEPDDLNAPKMADVVIKDLNEEVKAGLAPMRWVPELPLFN